MYTQEQYDARYTSGYNAGKSTNFSVVSLGSVAFPNTMSLATISGYQSFVLYKNIFPVSTYCMTKNDYAKSYGFSYNPSTGILSWTGTLGSGYDNVTATIYLVRN